MVREDEVTDNFAACELGCFRRIFESSPPCEVVSVRTSVVSALLNNTACVLDNHCIVSGARDKLIIRVATGVTRWDRGFKEAESVADRVTALSSLRPT